MILGLGFTCSRLAQRLLKRGVPVLAAVRGVERYRALTAAGAQLCEWGDAATFLPRGGIVVHSIPTISSVETEGLHSLIVTLAPIRVVYVSTTGVYGDLTTVDAETPAAPSDEKGQLRLEEEDWVEAGPWSSLVLRAAAIYGPGRGIHMAVREGRLPRNSRSGVVSRIHVDDLAALVEAGMGSELSGRWPVADEKPCASVEIATWCIERFGLSVSASQLERFPVAGRSVNGRKIFQVLGVRPLYPTWETGIPACLAAE